MTNQERIEVMTARLHQALAPSKLHIEDDSERHKGHAGAKTGLGHFIVHITSEQFQGQTRLSQHKMVYAALGDLMQTDIHALQIIVGTQKTSTSKS